MRWAFEKYTKAPSLNICLCPLPRRPFLWLISPPMKQAASPPKKITLGSKSLIDTGADTERHHSYPPSRKNSLPNCGECAWLPSPTVSGFRSASAFETRSHSSQGVVVVAIHQDGGSHSHALFMTLPANNQARQGYKRPHQSYQIQDSSKGQSLFSAPHQTSRDLSCLLNPLSLSFFHRHFPQ